MFQKLAVAVAAASALLAFATPAAAGVNDFVGAWANNDSRTDNITRVTVSRARPRDGGGIRVQAFGQCSPRDCDWGTVEARPYAPSAGGNLERDANVLIAQFNTSFSRQTLILRLTRSGVSYESFTDFSDRSGRTSYTTQGGLHRLGIVPPGGGPGGGGYPGPGGGGGGGGYPGPGGGGGGGGVSLPPQDCVGFNNTNLRVEGGGGSYRIMDGSHSIAGFPSQSAANGALGIIRAYGFTSQCFVVRPNAAMTYWLQGDNVPRRGLLIPEDCINVDADNVRVQNVAGSWRVVDGSNSLLNFGSNRAGADQAVAVIQHYNMNRQCFVGRPGNYMQYWRTGR